MHPQLRHRFDALQHRRGELLAELQALRPEQRSFRPAPDAWSAQQVAEHLLLVEQGVLRAVAVPGREEMEPRTVRNRIGALLVRVVFMAGIRVRVPVRGIQPGGTLALEEIAAQWNAARAEMARFLEGVAPGDLNRALLRHPVAGPMDLRRGLDFLAQHWDHHLRQIRRIRRSARFPA